MNVSGTVLNYFTGRPVAGATVMFGSYVATTNANGYYSLTNLPPARYPITIIHRDYETTYSSADLTVEQAYTLGPLRIKPIFRAL